MKDLSVRRSLDEDTRKEAICMNNGDVYSLHITENGEAIITDYSDYSKIYAIYSLDFFNKY